MSVDYSARVICGFEVETDWTYRKKTKYNEDTGEPYTVREKDYRVGRIEGREFITEREDEEAMGYEATFEGLQFLEDAQAARLWLGVPVAVVDGWAAYQAEFAAEIPEAVAAFAKKRRFMPKWFLVLDVG